MSNLRNAKIVTEIALQDILDDWFANNEWGELWNGVPSTPDSWILRNKKPGSDTPYPYVDELVIRFIKKERPEK